jgi:HEAT repeat protein
MTGDVQSWIAQLGSSDRRQQAAAAEALARLGSDARPAAAALVKCCGSADDTVRDWAVAALEELGPPPPGQIGQLIELARDQSLDVAYWAITLLGRAGDYGAPAVAVLTDILCNSTELSVRERAAWTLGKIGPAAEAALPALRAAVASDEPRLRRLAENALEAIAG